MGCVSCVNPSTRAIDEAERVGLGVAAERLIDMPVPVVVQHFFDLEPLTRETGVQSGAAVEKREWQGRPHTATFFRQCFCRKVPIMNIRELAKLTGTPERQIRYMIAEGFVPPPSGGRAYADYGDGHVAAIYRYTKLRQQGFPPQAIKVLLAGGKTAPFPVVPGITLQIDPDLLGAGLDADELVERIRKVAVSVIKDQNDASHQHADRKRSR